MNLERARSGAECSSRNEGGVAGCHRLPEKAGEGGQPGMCTPPRAPSALGFHRPDGRGPRHQVRGREEPLGRVCVARARVRVWFPGALEKVRQTPTRRPCFAVGAAGSRAFAGARGDPGAEGRTCPRSAAAARAVPPPERPRRPRGGGWMARGLLAAAQLPPSWAVLCVFHAADRGGGGTPGEFVPLPRSVGWRSCGPHAGGKRPRSPSPASIWSGFGDAGAPSPASA